MKKLNQLRSVGYLLLLSFLASTSGRAFELSSISNDKEAVTHAYSRLELNSAKRHLQGMGKDVLPTAHRVLGETLNELEKNNDLCDLPFYRTFTRKLEAEGIPTSRKSILHLLIGLRSENLIDDLFFRVMEQMSTLNTSIGISDISASEVKKAESILAANKIALEDISGLYSSYKNVTLEKAGCSVDTWIRTANYLTSVGNYKSLRSMNALALSKNMITRDSFNLIEMYRANDVDEWDLTLGKYLRIIKTSKNNRLKFNKSKPDFQPNSLSSLLKDKRSNTTYRLHLYSRFDASQIDILASTLQETIDRMDATKMELSFVANSTTKTIPLSPRGQYLVVQDLLRKDLTDLNQSMFFQGTPVSLIDLVTAGVETGMVNGNVVDHVLDWDDLWNPEPAKRWEKLVNYGFTVTGTATIFLPPPYNVISSVALMFVSGFIQKKLHKQKIAGGAYDLF